MRGYTASLSRWFETCKILVRPALLVIVLAILSIVMLQSRKDDLLDAGRIVYREIQENLTGISNVEDNAPAYMKDLGSGDLKRMLAATTPATRAFALQALGERGDSEVLPHLSRLLNDTNPVELGTSKGRTTFGDLSKNALTRMIRVRITREPSNISLLLPYFSGAARGSLTERKAFIEILGDIREPLALPLLSDIANADPSRELREAARNALACINSDAITDKEYTVLRSTQVRIIAVMIVTMILLVGTMAGLLRKGSDLKFALLSLVPLMMSGGFAYLIVVQHSTGTTDPAAIDKAIAQEDIMTLRAMNYEEYTQFPGDSLVARYLVRIGNERVIRCLNSLPSVERDDFDSVKTMVAKRDKWIVARILAMRLGTPAVRDLAQSSDPAIRITLATTLGGLGVKDDRITETLVLLSKDQDDQVSAKAAEALRRIESCPHWRANSAALQS